MHTAWWILPLLLLAGCSGPTVKDDGTDGMDEGPDDDATGDTSDTDDTTPPPDESPGNDTEPRDPVTWDITIQGNDFVDGSITVQVGDTVRWTHEDGTTPHTVTAEDGTFDSGTDPSDYMTEVSNNEFSHTFETVDQFPYFCDVHASMSDTITVLESFNGTP